MSDRESELILDCTDCTGRRTILEAFNWDGKILLDHRRSMEENRYAVEVTIREPDFINHDTDYGDRDVYYRRGLLPDPYHKDYVKVVVVVEHARTFRTYGRIISAYATPDVKRGEKRKWPKKKGHR